jgi:DNA-binding response OmpR family regulator
VPDATIAYRLGADLYGEAGGRPEDNYMAVMGKIDGMKKPRPKQRNTDGLLSFDDILFLTEHHRVFVGGVELKLSKIELDILQHMMKNPQRILTHDYISREFMDGDIHSASQNSIYCMMMRLRKKIKAFVRAHVK